MNEPVTVNGKTYPLQGSPVALDFLKSIGFERRQLAVELNGEPLAADQLKQTEVKAGDRFEVVQLVGGG